MTSVAIHARYVFPVAGPPIADGWIRLDGSRIATVGAEPLSGEVSELGNAAILPGLVNAHAHLDFSDLVEPLGWPGIGFVDWLRLAIEYRRASNPAGQTVARGLLESARGGVTTLGEIVQAGVHESFAKDSVAGNRIGFLELIAPTRQSVTSILSMAWAYVSCPSLPFRPGLSPHAPYTVHRELLASVASLSAAERFPLAMHLAESREELELLQHGTGPFRDFLAEMGAWDATASNNDLPSSPFELLQVLASAHRALVVHGNYLGDEEIAFLGKRNDRMAVVYCPRTHDWFAHEAYPLEAMLKAGVVVALGTDGRGSSPDGSLFAEMRHAARRHPSISREQFVRMATLDGARAMGLDPQVGSLEPGKQADLAIVALPDRDAADPHDLLFDADARVTGRWFRGQEFS
jgi:aminodeoxyfutalosine deaminase